MDRPVTQVCFAGLVIFISRLFCTLQRPCCFHYLSNICQRNPEMELRLEPKNSRAPNPYGSFPWMLGKNNLLQNLLYFLLFCIVGPGAVMCGRNPGDFIDITITSCPPEVRCCLIITIDIITASPLLQVYTCDSGACIALANKCNSKIECLDESDETNCQYLEVL